MPPTKPGDAFAGAEGEAQAQRREALKAVAQFGRAGLEQGNISARRLRSNTNANVGAQTQVADEFRVPDALRQQLGEGARASATPYADDAKSAQLALSQEFGALNKAQDTYFGQVVQAVPALRAENSQLVEQYRQAYEERQAQIRAEAEAKAEQQRQAIMQQNMQREAMAQSAQIAAAQQSALAQSSAAQLAAIRASAAQLTTPTPAPTLYQQKYQSNPGSYSQAMSRSSTRGYKGMWRR